MLMSPLALFATCCLPLVGNSLGLQSIFPGDSQILFKEKVVGKKKLYSWRGSKKGKDNFIQKGRWLFLSSFYFKEFLQNLTLIFPVAN